MVQISSEKMLAIRQGLEKMEDFEIVCGPQGDNNEVILVKWQTGNIQHNVDVVSLIDGKEMTGLPSLRFHSSKDYFCKNHTLAIRWIEVFLISSNTDSSDPIKMASDVAKAVCAALTPFLSSITEEYVAIRVSTEMEKVFEFPLLIAIDHTFLFS